MMKGFVLLTLTSALALSACDDPAPAVPPVRSADGDPQIEAMQTAASRIQNDVARIDVEPSALEFRLDGLAQPQVVTVRHIDGGPARIRGLSLKPETAPFSYDNTCVGQLDEGATCQITIRGIVSAADSSSVITLEGDSLNGNRTIVVTGVAPAAVPLSQQPTISAGPSQEELAARAYRDQKLSTALRMNPNPVLAPAAAPFVPPAHVSPYEVPTAKNLGGPSRDLRRTIPRGSRIVAALDLHTMSGRSGTITATLSYPVWGNIAQTGIAAPFRLLNQGAKLIGTIESGTSGRAYITINQVTDIDGRTILLQPLQAHDAMGRSGTPANVDSRVWERALVSTLAEIVTVAPLFAFGEGSTVTQSPFGYVERQSGKDRALEQLVQRLDPVLQDIVRQAIDAQPRQSVPLGTLLTIIPQTDWVVLDETSPAAVTAWRQAGSSPGQGGNRQ